MDTVTYDYVAVIAYGIGEDVGDYELTCSAESMLKAAEYFDLKIRGTDHAVVSIEQTD